MVLKKNTAILQVMVNPKPKGIILRGFSRTAFQRLGFQKITVASPTLLNVICKLFYKFVNVHTVDYEFFIYSYVMQRKG